MANEDKAKQDYSAGPDALKPQDVSLDSVQRPRIDKSRLPDDLQNSPRVRKMVEDLQEFLEQPGSLEKIYFHEGCHLYYFSKIHPTAKFVPPCIWYYKKTGQYRPVRGAVDTEGFGAQCDEARLLAFAKSAVSGGVMLAERDLRIGTSNDSVLTNMGDDEDLPDFRKSCEEIRRVNPGLPMFDADDLWHDARIKVAANLFDPLIRPQIDAVVAEVKAELLAAIYPDVL